MAVAGSCVADLDGPGLPRDLANDVSEPNATHRRGKRQRYPVVAVEDPCLTFAFLILRRAAIGERALADAREIRSVKALDVLTDDLPFACERGTAGFAV